MKFFSSDEILIILTIWLVSIGLVFLVMYSFWAGVI